MMKGTSACYYRGNKLKKNHVVEIESQPLSGRGSFSTIVGGKPPSNVQFQQCDCTENQTHVPASGGFRGNQLKHRGHRQVAEIIYLLSLIFQQLFSTIHEMMKGTSACYYGGNKFFSF